MKRGMHRLGPDITANTAKRMCFEKKTFENKNDARDFGKRNAKVPGHTKQTPYRCPLCMLWHLTSLSKQQSAAARQRSWRK